MKWTVVARPQAKNDVLEAADWYDRQQPGLGDEFIEEVVTVFDALAVNPLQYCRRHPIKNIRWRYPKRFPSRHLRGHRGRAACRNCNSNSRSAT